MFVSDWSSDLCSSDLSLRPIATSVRLAEEIVHLLLSTSVGVWLLAWGKSKPIKIRVKVRTLIIWQVGGQRGVLLNDCVGVFFIGTGYGLMRLPFWAEQRAA